MFSPLTMKHVLLQVMTDDLPQVSLTLAELGVFSPDHRVVYDQEFPVIPGGHYREMYTQARSRLEKISRHIKLSDEIHLDEIRVVSESELEKNNDWLGVVWERCSAFEESAHRLKEEELMVNQLQEALENFSALDIDLSLLHEGRLFLDIRVGLVPRSNVSQLQQAVSLANYLLFSYMEHEGNVHVVVVGPKGTREDELGSVLDTAGFRALPIPKELQAEPDQVRQELERRRENIAKERKRQNEEMDSCAEELREQLESARRCLMIAEPFVQIDNAARSAGYLSIISGWIPARDIKRTRKALSKALDNPFLITTRSPLPEERPLVPSYMPSNRLMAPFASLVKQYGIPRYGEVDPTAIFAITFIVMFGMMFGDIGHGLTIMLAAWLARKKLKKFTTFAMCVGLAATVFGFLYGSIFGYEEILHALWIPPLSDPLYMLSVALKWGIGFLLLITGISIYNRMVQGDVVRAIFDTNGIVSAALYLGVLYGVFNLFNNGRFGVLPALFSSAALLTLLIYKFIEIKAPPGERVLVSVIETFETVTGYISNTLSFLRVAAFSLNHVALAIAVFTLANMMDTTGHVIMVILGNLFILILEGAIVTIQALRLEYFEGFSRFYSGDGREFKPLHLQSGGTA